MIDSYSFSFFDFDSIAYVEKRMGKETDEEMNEESKKDIVNHPEEWKRLFEILHKKYDD